MTANRILLIPAILVVAGIALSLADESVPFGTSFVSPDGQHSVQVEEMGGRRRFVIRDIGTGQLDTSIEMPTLLLYLHWAVNSKSFVTVEHIARGSRGRVVYLASNTWRDVEVKPPFDGMMHYTVISLKLETRRVHYKFGVEKLTPNWKPIDYWFCDVDVSLGTGQIYNVQWTPTSATALGASLLPKPTYVPAMER